MKIKEAIKLISSETYMVFGNNALFLCTLYLVNGAIVTGLYNQSGSDTVAATNAKTIAKNKALEKVIEFEEYAKRYREYRLDAEEDNSKTGETLYTEVQAMEDASRYEALLLNAF